MKTNQHLQATAGSKPMSGGRSPGFSLIELLVVIAIIAILAGMILAVAGPVRQKALVRRVQGELAQLEMAIGSYKLDQGFYPPDNRNLANSPRDPYADQNTRAAWHSLYYELGGVDFNTSSQVYTTTDGNQIASGSLETAFGVGGVFNSSRDKGSPAVKNYIQDYNPTQFSSFGGGLRTISVDAEGPIVLGNRSAICYVSSAPRYNAETFDLWVDVFIGSKTNRISNWSEEPQLVSY